MAIWYKKVFSNPESWLVLGILIIALLAHGLNMFRYPYYENDEGTYMSQAWSLVTQGKLAPYTYTYDHAPFGWIQIAIWTFLTGGFFNFGSSINSGRMLVLIFHLLTSLLLYLTAKKLTNSPLISAFTVLIFTLSPLQIYFGRRVLLDNFMIFWVMLSLTLLLYSRSRLIPIILSGLSLGLAAVTKENALFFVPGFIYLFWGQIDRRKIISLFLWLIFLSLPILAYLGYAQSRGELFPYGSPWGGSSDHVSLITTWQYQLNRPGGSLLDPQSPFRLALRSWFMADPFLIVFGSLAILFNIYLGIRHYENRIAALFSILFIIFLVRGGFTLEFYILPLIPFLALNISFSIRRLIDFLSSDYRLDTLALTSFGLVLLLSFANLLFFGSNSKGGYNLYTSDQTGPQNTATSWVLSQYQPEVFYAIDNYNWVDLHAKNNGNFKYAEYYWKIDRDPAVGIMILGNDWRYISYLLLTPQMKGDITLPQNNLKLVKTAYDNSGPIQHFYHDGWGVDVMLVKPQ